MFGAAGALNLRGWRVGRGPAGRDGTVSFRCLRSGVTVSAELLGMAALDTLAASYYATTLVTPGLY